MNPTAAHVDETLLWDESRADVRLEFAAVEAELALGQVWRAHADVVAAVGRALGEARRHPEVFVAATAGGAPDPDAREFVVRAAVAELATRLAVSEAQVRAWGHEADVLRGQLPGLWSLFREGRVAPANVRVAVELVGPLPESAWRDFDEGVIAILDLPAARFRPRARSLAARLDAATLAERHMRSAADRRVWLEPADDGMTWLLALLPAVDARRTYATLDAHARRSPDLPLPRGRADALVDLVAGRLGEPGAVGVTVSVTVPVQTLLGESDMPASLEGLAPVDAVTARRLAGGVGTWWRILTDPVSGAPVATDPTAYRIPAAVRRWVTTRHSSCVFPGCGVPATR